MYRVYYLFLSFLFYYGVSGLKDAINKEVPGVMNKAGTIDLANVAKITEKMVDAIMLVPGTPRFGPFLVLVWPFFGPRLALFLFGPFWPSFGSFLFGPRLARVWPFFVWPSFCTRVFCFLR